MRPRFLLAPLVLVGSVAMAVSTVTPRDVENSIATTGARQTLQRIYEDKGQWTALLAGIATGEPVWLNLAKQLRRVSDGGASEQIDLAAGEALEHRPADVLTLVADEFGLPQVCGGPDVDDPRFDSYDLSMAAIQRRLEMLHSIHDGGLAAKRAGCISELEKAKTGIAHFYKHGA